MRKLLALLAVVGAGGILTLALRAPSPLSEGQRVAIEGARAALRRARVEAAGEAILLPALAAGERMERRLAEAGSTRMARLSAAEIARLAAEAEGAAVAALQGARERDLQQRRELAARQTEMADRFSALAGEVAHLPSDRPLRSGYERARLEIEAAGAASRSGNAGGAASGLAEAARELAAVEERLSMHYARLRDPLLLERWQGWVDETAAESRRNGGKALLIDKLARLCMVLAGGRVVASYPVELGRNGLAGKQYAGDAATPEGRYHVVEKRGLGATRYHRALLIDYPTDDDRRAFQASRRQGRVPEGRGIGGLIEIHGHGGHWTNWTNGCIALRDPHIDQVFDDVEVGTPVTIVGTARAPGQPPPEGT